MFTESHFSQVDSFCSPFLEKLRHFVPITYGYITQGDLLPLKIKKGNINPKLTISHQNVKQDLEKLNF